MSETELDRQWDRSIELASRPDSSLPPELRHDKIREVRRVGTDHRAAYQIVFDQHFMPYEYWNPKPDGWEITYARTEYDNDFDGLLGWILPQRACTCIVVTSTTESSWWNFREEGEQ